MKLNISKSKKIFMYSGLMLVSVTMPLVLTSCANVEQTIHAKIIDTLDTKKTYSQLGESTTTLYDAMYGSNFNNGNYIFIYGTSGSPSFREYAYGKNGNLGSGSNATIEEQNFSTSDFISSFFQPGSLGTGILPYNVKILTYMDLNPYNAFASSQFAEDNDGLTPFETWTDTQVLALANDGGTDRYDITTLPNEYKFKIGTYKRYDNSAVDYRSTIEFLLKIRPSVTGVGRNNKDGGLIAFKQDSNPKTFELAQASIASITTYYQTK